MRRLFLSIFFCAAILLISTLVTADDNVNHDDIYFEKTGFVEIKYEKSSPAKFFFGSLILFFQKFISPVDNRTCIFTPSCSVYGKECIKRHGFITAYPMIAARLIRCNPSAYFLDLYEKKEFPEGIRLYDPVR